MTDTQDFCKSEYAIEYDGWSFEPAHGDSSYWLGVFDRFPREPELNHDDAEEIYDALAFMNWKSGVTANVHLTINWAEMGLPPSLVSKRLGRYLNELQKWLAGGTQVYRRRGNGPRPRVELHYVWVHEVDLKRGIHSHILLHIPHDLFPSFRAWTSACIERHHSGPIPPSSVFAKLGYGKTDGEQVSQQWHWFKYIIKQLSPTAAFSFQGRLRNSREFFNPYRKHPTGLIAPTRMSDVSRNINEKTRERASFVSFAQRNEVSLLYDGYELAESNPRFRSLNPDLFPSRFIFPGIYNRPKKR